MRTALALFALLDLCWGPGLAIAQVPTARPTVVFFAPTQLEPDMRSALEDALLTQLVSLPVDLVFKVDDDVADTLEERMDAMKQTASEKRALAVFWLEIRRPERWFLYTVDAQVERVVLRPLPAKPGSLEATLESVAVVVRATTNALLHGEPLAAAVEPQPAATAEPKPKPQKPWPVVHANVDRSALRLAASYVGTTFADKLPWQAGMSLQAAWIWSTGAFVGLGYTFYQRAQFPGSEYVHFDLDRYPFALQAGLRFPSGRFTFTGELAGEVELRARENIKPAPSLVERVETARKITFNICPKLEGEFSITSWLRVFLGVGADFVLGNFPYAVAVGDSPITLVKPWGVRFTLRAGVAMLR